MFVHQLLGTRYVVVDSGAYNYYLPSEYYELINDDGQFAAYEVKNYSPFMIYDTQISQASFGPYDRNQDNHLEKQKYYLNYISLDDKAVEGMNIVNKKVSGIKKTYSSRSDFDEETNMVCYDLSGTTGVPSKGLMHFYFLGWSGARAVEFQEVILEYSDGRKENAFQGYAFYEEMPTKIWIYANGTYNDLNNYQDDLFIEYTDYTEYEKYLERMQSYSNLELKMDGSSLHLSYHRDNDAKNIVVVPVTYNDCWQCDDYETVKTYGGLLGVVIPSGSNDISLTLRFKPRYINGSALISIGGMVIYGLIVISYNRRLKEDDENNNYCSLL